MKNPRFYVRLQFLIPAIIACIGALSAIVTYQVTSLLGGRGLAAAGPVALWVALAGLGSFLIGLLITGILLNPVREFVRKAETMAGSKRNAGEPVPPPEQNEVARFAHVFHHVTELLGSVEANELFPEIVGRSKRMREVLSMVRKVAPSEASILILGESGTGKELVARSVHAHSERADRPFVAVNCSAIPSGLLESELFGHEKGAFTGAASRKAGKFEAANGGSVFLDEIADMPVETQAKILRALERKEIERVGGTQVIPVDVRFIAASNKNVADLVAKGTFREDLFFRLSGFCLSLPPLRERKEDIPLLADHFLAGEGKGKTLTPEALQWLMTYHWPGNVRELRNVVGAAALLAGAAIEAEHLPPAITNVLSIHPLEESAPDEDAGLDQTLAEMERAMIIEALRRTGGVQRTAAGLLRIKERSLWHRIEKYGIDVSALKKNAGRSTPG